MSKNANILSELRDLNSSLGETELQPVYHVPAGYFDSFPGEVLKRIKALESSDDPATELEALSPLLSGLSKKMPLSVPGGYFDSLSKSLEQNMETGDRTSGEEEVISPLLSELKYKSTYTTPQGYFDNFPDAMLKKVTGREAKVVSMGSHRNWLRYAAAAVMIGFFALTGLLFFNKQETPNASSEEMVKKMMKKWVPTISINL